MNERRLAPLLTLALWIARPAGACVTPPSAPEVLPRAECRILFPDPVFVAGEPIRLEVTVANLGIEGGGPPFVMDQDLLITPQVREGRCDGLGQTVRLEPGEAWLFLDDASAPAADQPSTGTQSFVALPPPTAGPGEYLVSVHVQKGRDGSGGFECDASECITVVHPRELADKPSLEIVQPVQEAAAGDAVPFGVIVRRNGRPVDEPLTLRVLPGNSADPTDLFPVEPEGLDTTGMVLVGEEEHQVEFTCRVHGPCYVGVSNEYHVTLHSGDELLCDTRWGRESGVARVVVAEAELFRWHLVEVLDENGDGRFAACEPGRIRLQGAVRNPWVSSTMTDTLVVIPLPPEVEVAESDLYFHDNPMDAVDPTRAELESGAVLTRTADGLTIEVGDLAPREMPGGSGPVLFRDLIDIDLLLELPEEGPGDVFGLWGPTVTGTAQGVPQEFTAPPLVFRDGPDPPPGEVAAAGSGEPLLFDWREQRWTWGRGDGTSESFVVQRGALAGLPVGDYGDCVAGGLTATEWRDPAGPEGGGWFYLVSGQTCGRRGPAGFASDGRTRYSELGCP